MNSDQAKEKFLSRSSLHMVCWVAIQPFFFCGLMYKDLLDLGADYMKRVVPVKRVDLAKRVDFEIAITCTGLTRLTELKKLIKIDNTQYVNNPKYISTTNGEGIVFCGFFI